MHGLKAIMYPVQWGCRRMQLWPLQYLLHSPHHRRRRRRLLLLQSPWHCKHIILVSAAIAFDWAETGLHCWPVMELHRLRGANILYSSRHILHRGEEDISR